MFLIINTANPEITQIILARSGRDFSVKEMKGEKRQGERLLSGVDKILQINKAKPELIKGIGVVAGPGGFTALRIGVATANALAFAWNLPIAGIKLNEFKNQNDLVENLAKKIKKAKKGSIVLPYYRDKLLAVSL